MAPASDSPAASEPTRSTTTPLRELLRLLIEEILQESGFSAATHGTTDFLISHEKMGRLRAVKDAIEASLHPGLLSRELPAGGLVVHIYRANDASSPTHRFALLVRAPSDAPSSCDVLGLVLREHDGHLIATPPGASDGGYPYRFSGNFIYTSDSRFPASLPIPLWDRRED